MRRINQTDLREQCRALPQKLVLELLGFSQWIELQRFVAKWKLPLGGAKTDLFAVFQELRSFTKQYGPVLKVLIEDLPADGSEGELGVRFLRAKIQKVEADARMSELRIADREGRLRDVALVSSCLELLVNRMRSAGERARRNWGDAGYEFFKDVVDGFGSDLRGFIDAERTTRMKPDAGKPRQSPKRLPKAADA
ncbi:MAG: hypothetical protein ACKV2Q_11135 [Planctomycetaceae bacterium]